MEHSAQVILIYANAILVLLQANKTKWMLENKLHPS